jgi:hypothetical protein
LLKKYNKLILKTLHDIDDSIKELEFIIKPQTTRTLPKINIEYERQEDSQLKFEEFKINKETNLNPRYTFNNFVVGSFNEIVIEGVTGFRCFTWEEYEFAQENVQTLNNFRILEEGYKYTSDVVYPLYMNFFEAIKNGGWKS